MTTCAKKKKVQYILIICLCLASSTEDISLTIATALQSTRERSWQQTLIPCNAALPTQLAVSLSLASDRLAVTPVPCLRPAGSHACPLPQTGWQSRLSLASDRLAVTPVPCLTPAGSQPVPCLRLAGSQPVPCLRLAGSQPVPCFRLAGSQPVPCFRPAGWPSGTVSALRAADTGIEPRFFPSSHTGD